MIKIIVFLAEALARSFSKMIKRLDIKYEPKERIFIGDLYLSDQDKPDFEIREDGTVVKYFRDAVIPTGIVFDTEDPSPDTEQTAANAMENMKAAVDDLKIPFKPKEEPESAGGGGNSTAEKPEGQQVSNAKEEIAPAQPEEEPKKRPRDRQEKILRRYNEGWTKVKIAQDLGIGLSTVNYHIQALRDKGKIQ